MHRTGFGITAVAVRFKTTVQVRLSSKATVRQIFSAFMWEHLQEKSQAQKTPCRIRASGRIGLVEGLSR